MPTLAPDSGQSSCFNFSRAEVTGLNHCSRENKCLFLPPLPPTFHPGSLISSHLKYNPCSERVLDELVFGLLLCSNHMYACACAALSIPSRRKWFRRHVSEQLLAFRRKERFCVVSDSDAARGTLPSTYLNLNACLLCLKSSVLSLHRMTSWVCLYVVFRLDPQRVAGVEKSQGGPSRWLSG